MPLEPAELPAEEVIGFDDVPRYVANLNQLGFSVSPENIVLAAESSMVVWEMVKRGLGVAPMHREIADLTLGVVRLFPDMPAILSPIWVVTHERMQNSPRIMLVRAMIEDAL